MATQPTNPFQNSSGAASAVPATPARMALDNLLRRELKVSDPNDAKLVAEALLTRYKDTPKAIAIQREAQGVPFLNAPTAPLAVSATATSSDAELQQAIDDVNRDLQELTTNTILKDVTPELQGWATAIRSAIAQGQVAARFALDRLQRDKVFGLRRLLGDYARMARLVGALTPSVNVNYRKLAQSLDEVAAVFLVMMGEALANVGFGSGRFLLQVPYSELQVRRDAAVNALRNLVGSTQDTYSPQEWQRGLHAYRELFKRLEQHGQGDLRALLVENELVRIMDELIQRAAHGNVEGLRALGATAQMDLERLRRLIVIGQAVIGPEYPPLTSFLESLLLFVEAFETSGGFRLLRIARPAILSYGLYGTSGQDPVESDLVDLVIKRNRLADLADCFMQCGCDTAIVTGQVILDKLLYDTDRAIDLYTVGTKDKNRTGAQAGPERRAAAYGYVIAEGLIWLTQNLPEQFSASIVNNQIILSDLEVTLTDIAELLVPSAPPKYIPPSINGTAIERAEVRSIRSNLMRQEICIQRHFEERWENLVRNMAPGCINFTGGNGIFQIIDTMIKNALTQVNGGVNDIRNCPPLDVFVPRHQDRSQSYIARSQAVIALSQADAGTLENDLDIDLGIDDFSFEEDEDNSEEEIGRPT